MSLATLETSAAAARSIAPCAATLRQKVLAYISSRGCDGATCDEIEQALGLTHQCASARLTEGQKAVLVVDLGERRKTRSGRNAVVWFSAEQGKV